MKKNAVIFDLDGTMWNACEPVLISWNRVLARHDGLPAVTMETIESFMGKTLDEIVSLFFTQMTHEAGYAEAFLSYYKFDRYFTDYEYSGRTQRSKGENIRAVISRNGIENAVYVGDTQSDCDAAQQAGVPFIFASYGFGNVDTFDASVSSVREIPAAAKTIFNRF